MRAGQDLLKNQLLLLLCRELELLLDEAGAVLVLAELDDITRDVTDVPRAVFGVVAELIKRRGRRTQAFLGGKKGIK